MFINSNFHQWDFFKVLYNAFTTMNILAVLKKEEKWKKIQTNQSPFIHLSFLSRKKQ